MTDISITASAVLAAADAVTEAGKFGATITAGQTVYRDPADNKYKLCDADSATALAKVPRGIALNGGSDGQPGAIIKEGDLTMNAVLTAGTAYYLSPTTAGGICPLADVASGDDLVLIGIAKSTTVLAVKIVVPGVTL